MGKLSNFQAKIITCKNIKPEISAFALNHWFSFILMRLWTKDSTSRDEHEKGPKVQKKTPLTKNWALTLLERGDLIGMFNTKAFFL